MRKTLNDKEIIKKNGYLLVTSKNYEIIPLFCPICDRPLISVDDELSYKKFKCCYECDTYWARRNFDDWNSGWRPTREQVEDNIRERFLDVITFNS